MDEGQWKYCEFHAKKAKRTNLLYNTPKYHTITDS